MPAQRAPSPCPGSAAWRSSAIMRSSFKSGALNDFVEAVQDIARCFRCVPALPRIDLNHDGIMRVALADKRRDSGIPSETAVPIGLTVNLDSPEHRGKARGGQKHLRRDLAVAKDSSTAGVHVCGGDKQLDRRCCQALEIDTFGQHLAKRGEARGR